MGPTLPLSLPPASPGRFPASKGRRARRRGETSRPRHGMSSTTVSEHSALCRLPCTVLPRPSFSRLPNEAGRDSRCLLLEAQAELCKGSRIQRRQNSSRPFPAVSLHFCHFTSLLSSRITLQRGSTVAHVSSGAGQPCLLAAHCTRQGTATPPPVECQTEA